MQILLLAALVAFMFFVGGTKFKCEQCPHCNGLADAATTKLTPDHDVPQDVLDYISDTLTDLATYVSGMRAPKPDK